MKRIDSVSLLLASLLLGITMSSKGAIAHQVPDFIKQPAFSRIHASQIRTILSAMETAANQKDVDGIVKYMAPNITIEIMVQLGNGTQRLNLSREQYRQYLQQGFATAQRRSSQYKNLKIQIAPNAQTATATYTLIETATISGQPGTFASTSQETVEFARIQGQVLETAVTSHSSIEVR